MMGFRSTASAGLLIIGCATWASGFFQSFGRFQPRLVWDPSTLVLVQRGGGYGRMASLPNGEILCSFETRGASWVRHSPDGGRTWGPEIKVAESAYGTAANPELLILRDGTILLFYNERPRDQIHPFAIKAIASRDNGRTWTDDREIYLAGTSGGTGCWEPAAVQLPSGEIHLFFANEKPYPNTAEQEITLMRSFDSGQTWSDPERVSFRPGHRHGMPVPLILAHNLGYVLAIEDNGMAGRFKPAIIRSPVSQNWRMPAEDGASERRWPALSVQLPEHVYAGAPYLRQLPGGETVLSVQSAEGRIVEGTHERSRMVVYIGDSQARNFVSPSYPFDVPDASSGLWNSLFIKNSGTVTAISGTEVNGIRGIWAIDGRIQTDSWREEGAPRLRAH